MNSSTEAGYLRELLVNLRRAIYSISVLAFGLSGDAREDALVIRRMMRQLLRRIKDKDAQGNVGNLDELFGAIILGLSILYLEIEEELKKEQVMVIQDMLLS
ncbi:hypothetical protein MetMK1DRAFT_00010480 [Metallosphaera yellowstonensis MK1]|uniref:Uncharacterized protein n=1 Tax=Metallosphaera yellowstonensis MK1 TaxID=671065 RepID=H2C2S4_9CREN|nr:hypothetical protein [Metallosphaera yellowstonensis]EHP70545.1 hypothetical protein MetMK1DRAFT_00010480 [Metallosphaera yellowstonensis MK1]